MKIIDELFGKNAKVNKIEKKGKTLIVDIDGIKYVIKEKNSVDINSLYDYLSSRDFINFPKLLFYNDKYNVFEYLKSKNNSKEEKANDLIETLSLLHEKTSYYKEIDINEYKEIFENISNKISYVSNYYTNLILKIEQNMFMSPSNYLLARNIFKIFELLNYSKKCIDSWYDIIKSNAKARIVTLYNNIDLDHIFKDKNLYLISWDKSIKGNPIYDLYNFYEKYNNIDFYQLLKLYENKFNLLKEEKLLLFSLKSKPKTINISNNEIDYCKNIKSIIDNLFRTDFFLSKYGESLLKK